MRRGFAALAAAALLLIPFAVDAQVGTGIAGGPALPMGSLGDEVESGFHGGLVVDLAFPLSPVGVRGDLMYQRLPGSGNRDSYSHLSATVNGRFTLLPLPLLSGYATAGPGLYSSAYQAEAAAPDSGRNLDFGLNGGVGARLNALFLRGFVEVRYHHVLSDPARGFVPITAGIIF
jgi:hypothetical protein